ncbi:helix-turn-helix domain-containing protein [Paenibacillus elgii]|uniref:helix-turn-helix domain-containing protein n=1 Tax=Paenibacillus elgii TaxID=189691 RepID=UPI00203D89F8|nr:helix-turn-helix domain-containing protein [Paenibacillus elgii]MCM3271135.1 XRE family transcriptional regulator [Paenibacillus elgii]
MPIQINLSKTLNELNITKNKLATEGKFRVATLHELENGKAKSITFEMLTNILDTANRISASEGKRQITINDIIDYIPDNQIQNDTPNN